MSFFLFINFFGNTSVLSIPNLTVDVKTNRGGTGTSLDGGTFLVGETVVFYFSLNLNVTRAKATLYFPDGTQVVLFNGSMMVGNYYDMGMAGSPTGWRRLVFEAWTADHQHSADEVDYLVLQIHYNYLITVSGLGAYSTGIYLDGMKIDTLKDGQSVLFYGLSGINKISVDDITGVMNGSRLYCSNQSITVNSDGNYTFQYERQYYVKIIERPYGWGVTSLDNGWYDAGDNLTVTASAASGFSFADWSGDYQASSSTITFSVNRSMSIIAGFRRTDTLSCQVSRADVRRLDSVTIYGQMTPSPGYAVGLAMKFDYPNGTREESVATDSNGSYQFTFSPDVSGIWRISVGWEGDDNLSRARSNTVNLTVMPKTYAIMISTNIVADQISLRVDGDIVNASSLPSRTYYWEEFTEHAISVDEYYEVGNATRFRFVKWGDDSSQLEKMLVIDGDVNVSASFITQYFLSISPGFGTQTGEGWYDDGSQAHAGIDRKEAPAEDVIYVYVFTGWGGDASGTDLTSGSILMNGPKVAIALWEKRLSPAFYIVIGIGMSLIAIATLFILRKKKDNTKRKM